MTELELKRLLEGFLWERLGGAETVDYVLVQGGANSSQPHHDAASTVSGAASLRIAVCLDGYFADVTQQAFLGEPTAPAEASEGEVGAAQAAGVAAAAGARVEQVAEAASAVIDDAATASGPRSRQTGWVPTCTRPHPWSRGNSALLQPQFGDRSDRACTCPASGIRIEDTHQ